MTTTEALSALIAEVEKNIAAGLCPSEWRTLEGARAAVMEVARRPNHEEPMSEASKRNPIHIAYSRISFGAHLSPKEVGDLLAAADSYNELLAACEAVNKALNYWLGDPDPRNPLKEIRDQLRTAIANAKGETK